MSRENARRFHFLREIASGGFGTVWLCKVYNPDGFTRLAAVKLLKQQWSDSDEIVRRMRDEARLLGLLRHRSIITVYDLTSIEGRAAVVMEYVEGVDLRTIARMAAERGEDVPVRAALDMLAAVASALDAAYNRPPMPGDKPLRVIHRDIKPSNVMVDGQGVVKVLDFGVARSDIENRESHTEELQFGSVDYMAPERLFFEPETPAGDVYGLGASFFEVLALEKLGKARGRPEQHATHIEDRLSFLRARLRVRSTVATELMDLLRACVAFEHERRPTAAELHQRARALARLVEDEELQPWAERVVPPLVEVASREPRAANAMLDSVRVEDSISRSIRPDEAPGPEGPTLGAQVRRGALRELDDSTGRQRRPDAVAQPAPQPAAPQPAAPSPAPEAAVVEEDVGDEWSDGPTYVGTMGETPPPPEQLSGEVRPLAREPGAAGPAGPDDPGMIDLPPARAVDGGMTIAPATGAPGLARGAAVRAEEIRPGYEAEPTVIDPEETTSGSQGGAEPGVVSAEPSVSAGSAAAPLRPTAGSARPKGRGTAVVLGGLAGGCLLFLVSGIVLAAGALWFARSGGTLPALLGPGAADDAVVEQPAVPATGGAEALSALAEDEPAAGPAAVPAAAPAADGLAFESLATDTRKLNVACTGGEAKGTTSATVALAQAERCTVTAIQSDRTRLVAVVDGAKAGSYACFADGESRCERR